MRKLLIMVAMATTMSIATYIGVKTLSKADQLSTLALENIEVLAQGEVSAVGCLPYPKATCLVFDGTGRLVYTGEDQYLPPKN